MFEGGPRGAPQARGSMELAESCAMRVTLLLRVSSLVTENELVIEQFFTLSGRRGSCRNAHPFVIIFTRRKPALAVRCQWPACRFSNAVTASVACSKYSSN